MDNDIFWGVLIIFFGLSFLFYITLRSRKIIKQIELKRSRTARELLEDLKNGV